MIKLSPPAVEVQSLNHWATREVPTYCFLIRQQRHCKRDLLCISIGQGSFWLSMYRAEPRSPGGLDEGWGAPGQSWGLQASQGPPMEGLGLGGGLQASRT